MGYTLDLTRIALPEYQQLLKQQNLLPGRRILLEALEARFALFAKLGLNTVAQLKASIATPPKLAALAAKTTIPVEYLTILRRELGSLEQKPVPLVDFPAVDPSLIALQAKRGMSNSKEYWEQSDQSNTGLYSLCDLVRINGVGAVAARAFYEAGFDSVAAVAQANAADMLMHVTAVNAQRGYYKAKLGEKDMQFCIDFASLLLRYQ